MTYPARDMLTKPADGHFVMIPLTKGKFALVDEGDAELVLAAGPWNASASSDLTWYATRSDRRWPQEVASMHVLVADHKGVDHVNGNGLDNRRVNLRPATRSQNAANRRMARNNTSGYKGVHWSRAAAKWVAKVYVDGRPKHLGCFDDPAEAARAYNRAAAEAFGEYARLNPI